VLYNLFEALQGDKHSEQDYQLTDDDCALIRECGVAGQAACGRGC